jgi:hypothetical protein
MGRQRDASHVKLANATKQARLSMMRRSVLEVTLAESYMRDNLSDEQIVHKFFYNIGLIPEKKDYFIRDFDDFYFKIRPKFGSKLIK